MHKSLDPRPSANPCSKPLSLRLPPMPYDDKAAFVETVCATLIESRFGHGYSYSFLNRSDGLAADELANCPSTIDEEYMAWYATAYQGNDPRVQKRKSVTCADAYVGRKFITLGPVGMSCSATGRDRFPTTLGRGSPRLV